MGSATNSACERVLHLRFKFVGNDVSIPLREEDEGDMSAFQPALDTLIPVVRQAQSS
jgi:hypothetical protein